MNETEIIYYGFKKCNATTEDVGNGTHCPPRFDKFLCWPATLAGTTAYQNCPAFPGFDTRRTAFKQCLGNASWYLHPHTRLEWSNYTTCIDYDDLNFRELVNSLFVTGYGISLAALLISLAIFLSFRSLRCTRIRIHIQLFISFVLCDMMWIVYYKLVVEDIDAVIKSTIWCQAVHLSLQYLMLANYFWMFCEGLHLHLALVVVFVRDEVAMRWFTLLGWVLPLFIVTLYAIVRGSSPAGREQCWMIEMYSQWIITAPVCISLIASLVFLINVLRVLLTKLHPNSAHPAPMGMRKAVRATLILVPLFGLQHLLFPFRPAKGQPYEYLYQVVSAVLISLQGVCVSVLFCFANQDVHVALKRWGRKLLFTKWDRQGYTGTANLDSGVANGNTPIRDVVV